MFQRSLYIVAVSSFLFGCSTAQRDSALQEEDWDSWCKMNYEEAVSGSSLAMNNIGACYADGIGGYPKNEDTARKWFTLAARFGSKAAQLNLTHKGEPIPKADLLIAKNQGLDKVFQIPSE